MIIVIRCLVAEGKYQHSNDTNAGSFQEWHKDKEMHLLNLHHVAEQVLGGKYVGEATGANQEKGRWGSNSDLG